MARGSFCRAWAVLAVLVHATLETGATHELGEGSMADTLEEWTVQPIRAPEERVQPLRRRISELIRWEPESLVEERESDDPVGAAASIARKSTADLKGITTKAMSSMQRVAAEAKSLANIAVVDKIKADAMLQPKDKSLAMYPLGKLQKAIGSGSGKGSGGNKTAFRDWWNAVMPTGEGSARREAQTRLHAAMKEIAASRKREKAADLAEKNRLAAILADEKKRQNELLKETMMNTSENGWWNLPKWQPENKTDYDVTKGYPPPAMPKEWTDIYGPNATSYINGTSLHIAYDAEGYPKPWNNTNSTGANSNATSSLLGSARDSKPVAAQDDESLKDMQATFDKDLTRLSKPGVSLEEGNGNAQLGTATVPGLFPTTHTHLQKALKGQDVADSEVHILDDLMGNPVVHLPVPMGDDVLN